MSDTLDPRQPLQDTPFAVLDMETTGLSPAYGHRVCEVACLRLCDSVTTASYESLVDPGRSISPGAYAVNRITADMLRGAPCFRDVAPRLLALMEGAVLVAHNAPFDLGFLASELEIARLRPPQGPVVDTLTLARRAYNLPQHNLTAVAAALRLDTSPTHRAMGDAQTTAQLLDRLLYDLERRWGITHLGQLLDFQGGPIPYPLPYTVPLPPTIADALAAGGVVRLRYVDRSGNQTERTIRPLRVSESHGNLYLVAHCYLAGDMRTFRLDRVVEMALLEKERSS